MTYIRPGFMVVIVGATLTSLSTVVVAMRYYCRYFLTGVVTTSDHLILTALVLTWGNFVVNYYQDISSSKTRPSYYRRPEMRPMLEEQLRGTLITWWVYRMSYVLALGFVKLSILFFYRVIASQNTFRRLVNGTIIFVSLYTFAAVVAGVFQCRNPVEAWSTVNYFAIFDGTPAKKFACYDPTRLWIFCGAANLLSDVVTILLPIPALLSLRVPVSKRLALIGIFSIGIMAIVASCVRMWIMMLWAESPQNSARFGADLLLWGQVETNAGIISASVPFTRLLFTGKERVERGIVMRRVEVSPPKPMGENRSNQPDGLEPKEWAIDEKEIGRGGPNWGPFITVPECLSTGSRGSTRLDPTRAHTAV